MGIAGYVGASGIGGEPIVAVLSLVYRPDGSRTPSFRCSHNGVEYISPNPEPHLAYALIELGYDKGRPFHTVWDRGVPSMKWPTLLIAAGDLVDEDEP